MERVWGCVRKGKIEEGKEECRRAKEFWRAASLQTANALFPFDRFESWRKSCLQIATNTQNEHEFAIYSILGSSFPRSSSLLSSWEDQFWLSLQLAPSVCFFFVLPIDQLVDGS